MNVEANMVRVGLDGSFRIGGIRPGRVGFYVTDQSRGSRQVQVMRVERDGAELHEEIEISPGENITGVKLFVATGSGTVRGVVKIEGGDLPENSRIHVNAQSITDSNSRFGFHAEVDERGRFVADDVIPGEYEIMANVGFFSREQPVRAKPARQKITVTSGAETEVTLVIQLEEVKRPRQ
jgi:hypothetical protein